MSQMVCTGVAACIYEQNQLQNSDCTTNVNKRMGPTCYSTSTGQTNCTWIFGHVQWYIMYPDSE